MKPTLILFVIVLIPAVLAAATFQPFLRSRYSQRWRQVTEVPEIETDSTEISTIAADKNTLMERASSTVTSAVFEVTATEVDLTATFAPLEEDASIRSTMVNALSSSTNRPATNPSTVVSLDYDYYGHSETDDTENKY